MKNPATKPTAKRTPGRPRNPELDKLQRELAISRRHAASMLKEQRTVTSAISDKGVTPLAQARLDKTLQEIRLLESKVRTAELEERQLAGELLNVGDAIVLYCAPLQTIRDQLGSLSKRFAVRLHGLPVRAIENALSDEADRIIALARASL